jgi:Tfp pilus assembly protein PilN
MIKINLIAEGRKPVVARKGRDGARRGGGPSPSSLSPTDMAFLGAIVVGALVAGGWFWTIKGELEEVSAQVVEAQREVEELKPIIAEVEAYKVRKAALEHKIEVIEQLKQSQRGPVRIMDQVSRAIPDLLWLNQLELNGAVVRLQGRAFSSNQVASFLENLGKVPEFQEPVLVEMVRQDGAAGVAEVYTFRINFNFVIARPAEAPDAAGTGG